MTRRPTSRRRVAARPSRSHGRGHVAGTVARVIRLLASDAAPMGTTDLALALGIADRSAKRYVQALIVGGFPVDGYGTGRYRLPADWWRAL